MKKTIFLGLMVWLLATTSLVAVVHSDGTNPDDWSVYIGEGSIEMEDGAIVFSGNNLATGYQLSLEGAEANADTLNWRMRYGQAFTVYVEIETSEGIRFLRYTQHSTGSGASANGEYIRFALGVGAGNNEWQSFSRHLEEDLQTYQPDNQLVSIKQFYVRGDVAVDDIESVVSAENGDADLVALVTEISEAHIEKYPNVKARIEKIPNSELVQLGYTYINYAFAGIYYLENNKAVRLPIELNCPPSAGLCGLSFVWVRPFIKPNGRMLVSYTMEDVYVDDLYDISSLSNVQRIASRFTVGEASSDKFRVDYDTKHMFFGNRESDWKIYSNASGNASVKSLYSGGYFYRLVGESKGDGFILGEDWHYDSTKFDSIEWKMRYSNDFTLYVRVATRKGLRYLTYKPHDEDSGLKGEYIYIGLGSNILDNEWHTIRRNLKEDLARFEPDNELLEINNLLVRGPGDMDNIHVVNSKLEGIFDSVYEDAEDGTTKGWSIYANHSGSAVVENMFDNLKGSQVIRLVGKGKSDGFMLGDLSGENAWNDTIRTIEWSMRYGEDFTVYIAVETDEGEMRYLTYRPRDEDAGKNGEYIQIGLGRDIIDRQWHTVRRNLREDLKRFDPDVSIRRVNGFLIRGMGRVDDIKLKSSY